MSGGAVLKSREPRDIADALAKAIAFEGKTNGRQRIEELQLTNAQVARRIVEIYEDVGW